MTTDPTPVTPDPASVAAEQSSRPGERSGGAGSRAARGEADSPPIRSEHLTIERRVRYAVLEAPTPPTAEIWYGLHGYNQLAHRFIRYLRPVHAGDRMIVAPEGLHRQYIDHAARKVGASWMTSEDRLTDIEDYVAYLDRLHARVIAECTAEPETVRVVGLGFSQGVHTLCRWIAFGRTRFDRAVLWGSIVPPDLDLEAHGGKLGEADLQLVVGDEDEYFGPDSVREHEAGLRKAGVPFRSHSFSGGHRLDADTLRHLATA